MSKYELSLSRDYVPNWTAVDAVRELFQNALDQQTTVEGNEMFFNYNEQEQVLYIGNKSSTLNVNTLLLGSSTKRNDPNTIGQFGEGYKIATLVLTRLSKKVTFYNYGAKEVWSPRFVKSRRYNNAEILTFFVDKKFIWQRVPDNNLTITIENVTPQEYENIVNSNLHCQQLVNYSETEYGRILREEKHRRAVYVNGLYVCDHIPFEHGYDFKPKYLKVDRDRNLARAIDIEWLSAQMWGCIGGDEVIELIKKGVADVHYMSNAATWERNYSSTANKVFEEFKKDHGEKAVPVTSQDEYNTVAGYGSEYTPTFVSSSYSSMIKSSKEYVAPVPKLVKKPSVKSRLGRWYMSHSGVLSKRAKNKLKTIMEDILE